MDKNKILEAWKSLPINNLMNFILKGEITLGELEKSISGDKDTKSRDRIDELKKLLQSKEKEMREKAMDEDTVAAYRSYLDFFGDNGSSSEEFYQLLQQKDTEMWRQVKSNPTVDGIKTYQDTFPSGLFIKECFELAEDLPWYQTKAQNTIAAYEIYKKKYPGKHVEDINRAIEQIVDEQDWDTACKNGTTQAYQDYLSKHPDGLHNSEALERINNRSGRDLFLDELRKDVNKFPVKGDQWEEGIIEKIENNVASWDDLRSIFTAQQIDAIRNYQAPNQLPLVQDFEKLPRGYTEVYFWGTRGTGKTCAIGATIGYLRNVRKSINPLTCPGERYLHQLENLFRNNGNVCSLPPGTVNGNLPAMAFSFKDKRNADHKTMLIDVAGEVFAGIFKAEHGVPIAPDEENAINHLKQCLNDKYNNKIHFFIVEYGNDDMLYIDGYGEVTKSQVMQSLAGYFAKEKLFTRSSVSMNILVTKCDKIKDGDRMERVQEYIENSHWGAVVNGINDISEHARCGGTNVMGFSIGNVFAQDLCIFRPDDAEGIVSEIEERTHGVKDTWFSRLIDFFRN
ncbi:MAG: hypothetical protein IJT39_05845 [Bacteroidales bacterium]|nr:hypothetical protein [Bacteroidales bacterium]